MPRHLAIVLLLLTLTCLTGCGVTSQTGADQFNDQISAAITAFNQGDPASANRCLSTAVQLAGGQSDAYSQIARRLISAGHPVEAVSFLESAVKLRTLSWNPMLWNTLADAARQAGDTVRAQTARATAAQRADEIMAKIGGSGTKPERDAPWSSPAQPFLQTGLYFTSDSVKDPARAIEALREAVRLEPQDPETLNALGYTLADIGSPDQYEEALQLTREAAKLAPEGPMILDSLGWALFKNNDLKGARRTLREAVDDLPDEPEMRYHMGVVYAQLGMTNEAENELTRALRLRPDYPEARRAKQLLHQPPGEGIVRGA